MRRRAAGLAAVVVLGATAGAPTFSRPPQQVDAATFDAAQRVWGGAPGFPDGVTYQPDVVVLERGPLAILGQAPDGFTWYLDAAAEGVRDLDVGEVAFVSGRVVGRIVQRVERDGRVDLTLAPVELTEVYRDLEVEGDAALDLDALVVHEAPDFPSSYGDAEPAATSTGTSRGRQATRRLADSPAAVPSVRAGGFDVRFSGGDGIGVTLSYNQSGVSLSASGRLSLDEPRLRYGLIISKGRVVRAEVRLASAASLRLAMQAASAVGLEGNIDETVRIPVDLTFPITPFESLIPFSVTFGASFRIQTAISAKDTTMCARGAYQFDGSLGFRYEQGGAIGPQLNVTTKESALQSLNGVSVGANGIVLAIQFRTLVGIGAFGFSTGVYFGLNAGWGLTRGSDLGLIVCKGGTLSIDAVAGIGYQLPRGLISIFNSVISVFGADPIPDGGERELLRENVFRRSDTVPDVPLCGSDGDSGGGGGSSGGDPAGGGTGGGGGGGPIDITTLPPRPPETAPPTVPIGAGGDTGGTTTTTTSPPTTTSP